MLLQKLRERWNWHEIRGCPGRFVVSKTGDTVSPEVLLDSIVEGRDASKLVRRERIVRDPPQDDVFVAIFLDSQPPGGLITFCKRDGTFVHTFNEPSGLDRKLRAMGYGYLLDTTN